MGLFGGGGSNITVNIPEVKVPTAQELFSQGEEQARRISPLAFGAREAGLGRLGELEATPEDFSRFGLDNFGEISPDFFNQFQPSDFEQGIASTAFEDLLRRSRRTASQQASLSGISSSFDERFERALAPGRFQIGQFLSGLGQRRGELALGREGDLAQLGQRQAELALQGRQQGILSQLSISPQQELLPFVQTGQQQGNFQAQLQRNADLVRAQADIANQIKAQQPSGFGRLLGGGLGALGGFALGGPAGALKGLRLGGGVGSIFGGDFGAGDALGLFGAQQNLGNLGFGDDGASSLGQNLGARGQLLSVNP